MDSEKTAICVAIDNEKDTHHSLQLSVDDNMVIIGEKVIINHSGRIVIGNRGSGKIEELRQVVTDKDEKLLGQGKFRMGTLTNNRLWCMDDEEIVELVENLISYAVIRDEYRAVMKGMK